MEVEMKANESRWDRVIRVVLGIALVALNLGGVVTGSWGIVLLVVGAISFVTGLIGICPLYALLKIRTNKA
jgi:hypothetical protein